jgi:DNA-binding LacI/PurR family transcriptional regulator
VKSDLKHREISTALLAEILAGKYGTSGRLQSEAQLVRRFGVSRPTVARALRDLQEQGLVQRRAGSGTFVRSRTPAATSTRQLALLIAGFRSTEIFELICSELASLARAHDYSLIWGGAGQVDDASDISQQHALELCNQLLERQVMGVFFAPFEGQSDASNQLIVQQFRDAGIPIVLLDRDLGPFPTRCDLDLVGIDNFTAGYVLAEHLLELGCKKVVFVARPHSAATVDARVAGVREALTRHEVALIPDWLRIGDPEDAKWVRSWSSSRRPDAVVCANDLTAAQLLRTLEKNGVRVPQQLRVVGFDDAKYATLVSVPLTTIHQPCKDIATTAFQALIERIREPTLPARSMLLTPRLVVRESCGAGLP